MASKAAASGVQGEGDWKSGERYNESLQEWGADHDAPAIAREAEVDLPQDLRDSGHEGTEKKDLDEEW